MTDKSFGMQSADSGIYPARARHIKPLDVLHHKGSISSPTSRNRPQASILVHIPTTSITDPDSTISCGVMSNPNQRPIEPEVTSSVKKRRLSLTRSFGKLPRLSKQLMYDSVRNQPLPPTSFASRNPSVPFPSPPNDMPQSQALYSSRPTLASPLGRSSSFQLPEGSPNSENQGIMESHSAGGNSSSQFSWREIFSVSGKASRLALRGPAEESLGEPDRATALVGFGTGRRAFRSSSLSGTTITDSQEFSQEGLRNDAPRRRSSAFENLSLPSIMSRIKSKRDSMATLSTQGDEPPPTPDGVAESHEAYHPSVLPDYGIPADPFGNYPAHIQQLSHLRVTGGPLDVPQDFKGFGELGRFELSDGEEWNISTPRRRTVEYEEVPQWVYASRSASPVDIAKDMSNPASTHSASFISCMGLDFPMPPPIKEADAPRLAISDTVGSGPFENLSHHRRSVSHDPPRASPSHFRRNGPSHRSGPLSGASPVTMVPSDGDEYAWPLERYNTPKSGERRRHRRLNETHDLPSTSSRPSASTDFETRIPAYRHSEDISPLEFGFKRFSPPEIRIFDPVDDA